jgi:tRNA1(Val) A37 N6-methylase TrmN6
MRARSAVIAAEQAAVSEDAVLGGRLILRQPRKGHRVGHDAMLLAAACSARAGQRLIDVGAGVGAAGLAVAARVDDLAVTLVEIDQALAALAKENAARNGLAARVQVVCLDVAAPAAAFAGAGLRPGAADHVLMNPPFNAAHHPSPDRGRRLAHAATPDTVAQWIGVAAELLNTLGVVTLIWRADGLDAVLGALGGAFGAIMVLPVHPKPQAPAIRVLVRALKGSRAPLALLPALYLADGTGRPTSDAEAVLRHGALLRLARD